MPETPPRKLTWKRQPVDPRDRKFSIHGEIKPTLRPLSRQLHKEGNEPPVWDQGGIGSCTAHGNGYALTVARRFSGRRYWIPSRLALYYMEREIEGTVSIDEGAYVRTGLKVAAKYGVAPEYMWTYKPKAMYHRPDDTVYATAGLHKASEYFAVAQNVDEIESCVALGFPVVFGFMVYDSIRQAQGKGQGVIPMPKYGETCQGGHCVAICGYNSTEKRFTIRNSWGPDWGDGGYGYLPYEYVVNPELASDFWTVRASM